MSNGSLSGGVALKAEVGDGLTAADSARITCETLAEARDVLREALFQMTGKEQDPPAPGMVVPACFRADVNASRYLAEDLLSLARSVRHEMRSTAFGEMRTRAVG